MRTTSRQPITDLVAAAKAGDGSAFAELVRRYRHGVYALCLDRTGDFDLADDLAAMTGTSPLIPSPLRLLASRMARGFVKSNIRVAERVTITLDSLRKEYVIPLNKAEILPNGVDTSLFVPVKNEGRTKHASIVLGYVGVLREWVDLRPVFDALRYLKDAWLVVVGKEGALDYNRRLADAFGVSNRVSFLGGVPYSEVPKHIARMDICLIPFARCQVSKHALPLKLFEYLSCGKPVIAAPRQGIKRIAGDKILYADSGEDYASCVQTLMDDPGWSKRLGKQGRHFVRERYDWSIITSRLKSIVAEI